MKKLIMSAVAVMALMGSLSVANFASNNEFALVNQVEAKKVTKKKAKKKTKKKTKNSTKKKVSKKKVTKKKTTKKKVIKKKTVKKVTKKKVTYKTVRVKKRVKVKGKWVTKYVNVKKKVVTTVKVPAATKTTVKSTPAPAPKPVIPASLNTTYLNMWANQNAQLVLNNATSNVSWSSSDPSAVSVNNGYIHVNKGGMWQEDGTITPNVGDVIMYNWNVKLDENGNPVGPNDGWADHVGLVAEVDTTTGMMKVLEGNTPDKTESKEFGGLDHVGYREINIAHYWIRGYIKPHYTSEAQKQAVLNTFKSWVGITEGSDGHRAILDIYNNHKNPLPRSVKMTERDSWCAACLSAVFVHSNATNALENGTEVSCEQMINLAKKHNTVVITASSAGKYYYCTINLNA